MRKKYNQKSYMMLMKRCLMPMLLGVSLTCSLAGCGNGAASADDQEQTTETSTDTSSEEATTDTSSGEATTDTSSEEATDTSGGEAVAQERVIPYPEDLETVGDMEGSDSFDNLLDQADSRYYTQNDYFTMKSEGTLHLISGFQTYQQTTEYTCGPASALMVLNYFGIDDYNELELAEMAGTDTSKGTSVEGMVALFEEQGFQTESHADTEPYFQEIDEAEAYFVDSIDAGIPVMVDWLDWRGHWQTVIGIDTANDISPYDDVLILADSYDVTDQQQNGYYIFSLGRFFDMWREGACAQKDVPYEQPFVKAWME